MKNLTTERKISRNYTLSRASTGNWMENGNWTNSFDVFLRFLENIGIKIEEKFQKGKIGVNFC